MAYLLKDSYNTGDDSDAVWFGGNRQTAQTFQASSSYTATKVRLKLKRLAGSESKTCNVYLYSTAAGLPDAQLVQMGTFAYNTISTDASGDWVECVDDSQALVSGTTYAVVITCSSDVGDDPYWRSDASSPSYANGSWCSSNDGGSSWSAITTYDLMFEVYAGSAVSYVDASTTFAASSTIEATARAIELIDASTTLAATSTISANASKSQVIHGLQTGDRVNTLIAFGNDELWYEDV
jgi:hypothetical protein